MEYWIVKNGINTNTNQKQKQLQFSWTLLSKLIVK